MNISNTIGSLFSRFRTGTRQDPVRDWLGLLTFSMLVFVSIVVWNVWAFDTVAQGGVIGPAANSTPSIFNSTSIEAIRTVFATRAVEEAKYVTGVYRYADPSQ